jgi:hypothetical protein
MAEVQTERKLRAFRSNRGGEFTSTDFTEHCIEHGVCRQLITPYTSQQNSMVECRNQTVVGTARSMIKAKGLPGWLWGEAVATTVYFLSHSPTKSVNGMMSFEAWFGKKPGVQHLRTFGCIVHVKNTSLNLKKLDKRSRPMVFIGYEPGSKAYRAYDPVARHVLVTRDVVFDEQAQWDWAQGGEQGEHGDTDMFSIEMEYMTTVLGAPGADEMNGAPGHTVLGVSVMPPPHTPPPTLGAPAEGGDHEAKQDPLSWQSPIREENLDANHDEDAPIWVWSINNILGLASPRGLAP